MERGVSLILILALVLSFNFVAASCGDYSYDSPINAEANSEYSSTYAASNAIDGSTSTYWFGKSTGFPKIITFDLGEEKCVNGMQINFFSSDVPVYFNVEISADKSNWKTVESNLTATEGNEFIDFDFGATTGRYLRITETNAKRKYGTITEIKVSSANSDSSSGGGGGGTSNLSCTDSDGGLDYYVRGATFGPTFTGNFHNISDGCIASDGYNNGWLRETYCNEDGIATFQDYECSNGCQDGVCLNTTNETSKCTDSDGGSNWQIKGTCSDKTGNYSDSAGTTIANSLREYYCGPTSWSAEDQTCLWVDHACFQYGTNYVYSNGTCASNETSTCTDTDGGKDYYIKGDTFGTVGSGSGYVNWSDFCPNQDSVREHYCDDTNRVWFADYDCPNGCKDGACVEMTVIDNKSCSGLKDFMKNPSNFLLNNDEWILNWNSSWSYGSEKYYSASFSQLSDYQHNYISIDITESEDVANVENRLKNTLENGLCEQQKIYGLNSDNYKIIYLCKNIWEVSDNQRDIQSNNNRVVAIWTEGNSLYRVYSTNYNYDSCYDYEDCMRREEERHREQQESITNFLNKLISNEGEYVSNLYLSWETEQIVKLFLNSCGSDIQEPEVYISSWTCKLEPAICPPHGYQNEICTRYNGNLEDEEVRESQISCNPGICSGCYIPKWFGGSAMNDKCIPYGFRFEQDTGEFELVEKNYTRGGYQEGSDRLFLEDIEGENEITVEIYSNNSMLFKADEWSSDTYYLTEGDELNLLDIANLSYYDEYNKPLQFIFRIDKIYFDSANYLNSYFDYTFIIETSVKTYTYSYQKPILFNMYCDIDGNVKIQKTVDRQGNWAACQNNYECESNICSSGECIELADAIREAKGFKSLFARVFCRLAHLLSEENYDSCISGFLA